MAEVRPLSDAEVRDVILTFWRLNADKAPVSEFAPILDRGFALVAVNASGEEVVRFDGLDGLEEHQAGKEVYFDQQFTLGAFECELQGDRAIAKTTGLWKCIHCEPGMARSEPLKADLAHTWYVRRSPESGRALLSLHVCTYFQYLPGFQPAPKRDESSGDREFHLGFDRHWTAAESISIASAQPPARDESIATERISGTVAAAVTPLRDGGDRLDLDALEPLLGFYLASGLDGVLVLGTTGEGIMLEEEERKQVAEATVGAVSALPVVVHCGAQTTAQTSRLAAHAAEVGAAGVAVIAPPYFSFAARELAGHFTKAAAACAPLPFYIYEYAERSGYSVPVAVVEEVRDRAPNLVGLKVSDGQWNCVAPYLRTGLDVFIGAEALIADSLGHGAVGTVSGVAAAFPEAVSALVGDPTREQSALVQSLRAVLSDHPFQASVKAALGLRGLPVRPNVRAPLQPLSPDAVRRLEAELESLLGADALTREIKA